MKRKLVFFVSTDRYFISHRLDLAIHALNSNFDVFLITSITCKNYEKKIMDSKIKVINIKLHRSGLNIFSELLFFIKLLKSLIKIKPDIIHNVALKPVIYGSIASFLLRAKLTINAIAGTGIVFNKISKTSNLLKLFIKLILSFALKRGQVIVQNNNDKEFVKKLGINLKNITLQNIKI